MLISVMSEMTIADFRRDSERLGKLSKTLNQVISDTPRLDIELLLGKAVGKSRSWVIAHPEFVLSEDMASEYQALLNLRLRGEPIAYLLGSKEFRSLDFRVTKSTLIPRPETELLVETALELFGTEERSFLDLGTGSGAIAIAIKHERENWTAVATDISFPALKVASSNSCLLNSKVSLICADWCSGFKANSFDMVVSNPPYIETGDPHLRPLNHEPRSALVAQQKGLGDLFTIIEGSQPLIKPGGYLVLEHGYDQNKAVCDKLAQAGYSDIRSLKDFNGLPRVCVGKYLQVQDG